MAYKLKDLKTWVEDHFHELERPLIEEKKVMLDAPLSDENKEEVRRHLQAIVDAQNTLIEVLKTDSSLPVYGEHYVPRYVSFNSCWEGKSQHTTTDAKVKDRFYIDDFDYYVREKLREFNAKGAQKESIEVIHKKLTMIRSEKERILGWLSGIEYPRLKAEEKKTVYDQLVEAGLDQSLLPGSAGSFDLTLTNVATGVTKGDFSELKTRSQKIAEAKAELSE